MLIYFGYNDFLPVAFRVQRDAGSQSKNAGLTDRELFEQRMSLRFRLTYALQKYSNLVRLFLLRGIPDADAIVLESKQTRVPEADRRWILSELRAMARHHGFQLVVVIPWYRAFDEHVPLLREVQSWDDVTVVDLPARLNNVPEPPASFFLDVVHPNPEGHRLIAREIGSQLQSSWQPE